MRKCGVGLDEARGLAPSFIFKEIYRALAKSDFPAMANTAEESRTQEMSYDIYNRSCQYWWARGMWVDIWTSVAQEWRRVDGNGFVSRCCRLAKMCEPVAYPVPTKGR